MAKKTFDEIISSKTATIKGMNTAKILFTAFDFNINKADKNMIGRFTKPESGYGIKVLLIKIKIDVSII